MNKNLKPLDKNKSYGACKLLEPTRACRTEPICSTTNGKPTDTVRQDEQIIKPLTIRSTSFSG